MGTLQARLLEKLQPYIMPMASLGVRGLGVLAGFAVTIYIGRLFGPVANGQYAIVSQTAIFLAMIAIGGLDLAVAREFPQAKVQGKSVSRRSLALVLGQSLGIAIALAGILTVASGPFLHMLGRPDLPQGSILLLCLILLSRTLLRMLATILRAQSYFLTSQAIEMLSVPLLTVVLIAAGLAGTVSEILLATLIAGCIAATGGMVVAWRESSGASDAWQVDMRKLYATAWPLWGVAIAQNFADWYGLVTITAIGGLAETGLFRVASQFAVSFSIITLGLLGTYSTPVSAAFHANDKELAAKTAGQATMLSLALVLPLALIVLLLAPYLLGLVGPEFAASATVLRVLLLGQIAFTFAGSASMVLAMSGHPRINLWVNLMTTAAIVLTAPFFVRTWGATGLAACISSLMAFRAISCVLAVRRLEGIDVLRGRLIAE
ncbi:lipopolysaccharide biosynthesis protein [Novosphingobium ginsenosidimutans]|uniref:Oligosaccharide flippase family protein n=1 Tax=Novosphingobium ginsenosidimutans TaxID=1176536 RepID=A0A5B8S7I7_9SPHN|nr:MATE family efflux transporter [Novosphingobium ginsenosidimutans]QEA17204.1 oligosaccharide flippase family protein [Novosphingobium ginsenosidimutans]